MWNLAMSSWLLVLAQARAPEAIERSTFALYKIQQRVGVEQTSRTRRGTCVEVRTAFAFTDRGTTVPLGSLLELCEGSPRRLEVWGRTARSFRIDDRVLVEGKKARIEQSGALTERTVDGPFFLASAYAPVTVIEELLRHWRASGRPPELPVFPVGAVRIQTRGHEAFPRDDGTTADVERWSISGLGWGRTTAWTVEKDGLLVGVKTVDTEYDHFEATRAGWTASLRTMVASAATDGMAELAENLATRPLNTGRQIALVGGTAIDASGRPPVKNTTVLVDGDRILAIGPSGTVAIPAGTQVIDVTGKAVLPGLWDMHAHVEQVEWGPLYLAAGVTTVRDNGNELDFLRSMRDAVDSGKGLGPRIVLACIVDGRGEGAIGLDRVDDPSEIPALIARFREAGCAQVKIYSSVAPRLIAPLARAAHAAGLTVTGHVPRGIGLLPAVKAGMDMVSHVPFVAQAMLGPELQAEKLPPLSAIQEAVSKLDPDSPSAREVARELARRHTVVDPTLALYEFFLHTPAEFERVEPGLELVAPVLRQPLRSSGPDPAQLERDHRIWAVELGILRTLHRAGVPIVAGTDQAIPGHSLHREVELHVEAGFTPMEALESATLLPARAMKLDREVGTLEAGKRADLIVVDGNPLQDIHLLRRVRMTMARGRLYETAALWKSVGFVPPP